MNTDSREPLGQLATVLMGQSPPSTACSESGIGLPFIQGNAEFGTRFPKPRLRCSAPTRVAEEGDLLLSVRAPVGELNQAHCKLVIGRGLTAIRFREVDQSYAWHALGWCRSGLNKVAQGSTFVAVSRQDVERLQVPWVSDRQRPRIAAMLDAVDAAIEKTAAVIAKLEQVRAGLLHSLLTRGLDGNGELRDPIMHPEQFKDSPIGQIPRTWDAKPLESCVSSEITYGIVQAGPHVEGGVPYIRTGDMDGDSLDVRQMLRTAREIATRFLRSQVRAGEIVCAIRATVGKVLPVPPELDGANLTQGTARIAPKPDICAKFLLWAIRCEGTQRRISLETKGTTFAEITLKELGRVMVPIPSSYHEQEQIAEIIRAMEDHSMTEKRELHKLQNLKSGLMSDLLTGRVPVQEAINVGA